MAQNNKPTENENNVEYSPDDDVRGHRCKIQGRGQGVLFLARKQGRYAAGDKVIVKTARGIEFGFVHSPNQTVKGREVVQPLRSVLRPATKDDIQRYESNKQLEKNAFDTCVKMIAKHGLDMKLIEAEYTFDNSKLLFYFSAEGRVDFRDLVKDLASVFHTRIELRQIGIRDEAKMMGGIGVCGRPFCCSTFLSDFGQVSQMAKEQNLSLNSAKISGTCGRLMCCLRFENGVSGRNAPHSPVTPKVFTPDGVGYVKEIAPLTGMCKVVIPDKSGDVIKTYHRDRLRVLETKKGAQKKARAADDDDTVDTEE